MGGICCCGGASTTEEESNKKFSKDGDRDISKGPLKKRGCTDVLCILLFIAHWGGFLFVTFLGVKDGNPRKLFMPRDFAGSYCGIETQWNDRPSLEGFEKQLYTMNVSATVDPVAKQLVCSSASENLLRSVLSTSEMSEYECACCKVACASCTGSLPIADLTSEGDLKTTITDRMQDLTSISGGSLFSASGPNGDLFSNMWSQATEYFVKVCSTACDSISANRTRTYVYAPAPDDPLSTAWAKLLDFPPSNDIQDTINTKFTFSALPEDVCPYPASKCVPTPGVEFFSLPGLDNYCQFRMDSDVVNAVGGAAATAFEGLAADGFASSATEELGTWLGEVEATVGSLVIVCFLAFITGLVFLVLLRFFIGVMVWLSICLVFALLVLGGAAAYVRSGQCAGASFLDSGKASAFAAAGAAENVVGSTLNGQDPLASETLSGNGEDYRGFQTRTVSGKTCQKWDDDSPHNHTITAANYPNAGLEDNYCRNPVESDPARTIWCFTTDPEVRWEICQPLGVIQPECTNGYAVGGDTARTAVKVCAFILWGIALLWCLLVCCMRSRIRLAIAVNKVAAMFIMDTPTVMILPVVQSIISLVWTVGWALSAGFLLSQVPATYVSSDAFQTYAEAYGTADEPGACNGEWPQGFVWKDEDNCEAVANSTLPACWRCAPPRYVLDSRFAFSFFSFLWNNAFLVACGQCTIAGAVGIWFFTKHGEKKSVRKIRTAIWNVVRYHSGSLAFGSLILAIIQFIRYFMKYLEKQASAQKNRVMVIVFKALQCILWCFEKCIKFLNKNAYIQVALLGTNFCTSAKVAFSLILRNFARFGIVAALGTITQLVGYTFITLATAVPGFFILRAMYPEANPVAPMVLFVIIGYVVGRLYMAVFALSVDTALQCFIITEEMGGQPADADEQYVPGPLISLVPRESKTSTAKVSSQS